MCQAQQPQGGEGRGHYAVTLPPQDRRRLLADP